jgi:hypothetical protein
MDNSWRLPCTAALPLLVSVNHSRPRSSGIMRSCQGSPCKSPPRKSAICLRSGTRQARSRPSSARTEHCESASNRVCGVVSRLELRLQALSSRLRDKLPATSLLAPATHLDMDDDSSTTMMSSRAQHCRFGGRLNSIARQARARIHWARAILHESDLALSRLSRFSTDSLPLALQFRGQSEVAADLEHSASAGTLDDASPLSNPSFSGNSPFQCMRACLLKKQPAPRLHLSMRGSESESNRVG